MIGDAVAVEIEASVTVMRVEADRADHDEDPIDERSPEQDRVDHDGKRRHEREKGGQRDFGGSYQSGGIASDVPMNARPLMVLAALAAAAEPDFGKDVMKRMKDGLRDGYSKDPMGTTATTVLVASWLFYKAEKGHNPKVNSFYDALVYVSTNLSVGYSDIFAKTPMGKTLGSLLMTAGPSMATRFMDEPRTEGPSSEETNRAIVERLDKILEALEKRA